MPKTKQKSSSSPKSGNLPEDFRYLMWSYDFSKVNPEEDKERLIVNTINYGQWQHWQWLVHYYGKERLRQIIRNIPASEFRERALRLMCLLLDIRNMKYASRSIKIRAKKGF